VFGGLRCSTSRMELIDTGGEMHQGAVISYSAMISV